MKKMIIAIALFSSISHSKNIKINGFLDYTASAPKFIEVVANKKMSPIKVWFKDKVTPKNYEGSRVFVSIEGQYKKNKLFIHSISPEIYSPIR